jgi:hypothetical protein
MSDAEKEARRQALVDRRNELLHERQLREMSDDRFITGGAKQRIDDQIAHVDRQLAELE